LLIVISVLISVPSIGIIFLQNSRIQTSLTKYIAGRIAEKLSARISVGSVSLTFINRLQLNDLCIEDQKGDTLLYAGKIKLTVGSYSRSRKEILLSRLNIEDSYIHLSTDTSGVLNLQFILDALSSQGKPDSTASVIKVRKFRIENSRLAYTRQGGEWKGKGINFADVDLKSLNCSLENFTTASDTVIFTVKDLNFTERSGFCLTDFFANVSLSPGHFGLSELSIQTPLSVVSADHIKFSFFDIKDFSDFYNMVGLDIRFRSSQLSLSDIAFFAPDLEGLDEEFRFAGQFTGNLSNLKGNEVLLSYGLTSHLLTTFTLIGLPDIKSTFLNFNITNLTTNSEDLQSFSVPVNGIETHLKLPASVEKLGTVSYSGKFTGYPDDFVAYGKFKTSLGELSSDLLLRPDSAHTLFYEGTLKTRDFYLGRLINQDSLVGRVTMNAHIKGYTSKKSLLAKMEGTIDSLGFNRYNYRNIKLQGTLTDKVFDGSFNISDPNIQMAFKGMVKLSSESPVFAFTADVSRARPYYLHLDNTDPGYFASFLLETNFRGKNIDDFDGEIRIVNSLFRKKDKQLQMYDFRLIAINNADSNRIVINSDALDGEVRGSYKFSLLPSSFRNLVAGYLPSLSTGNEPVIPASDNNSFVFQATLKNIHPVVAFFFPYMDLGNNTRISGHYRPQEKDVQIDLVSNLFSWNGNQWNDIVFSAISNLDAFTIRSSTGSLVLTNSRSIDNIKLTSQVRMDTALVSVEWDSEVKPLYRGKVTVTAGLGKKTGSGLPSIDLLVDPADMSFNDTVWHMAGCNIKLDSGSVSVDSFRMSNQNQNFLAGGKLSWDPEDAMRLTFKDIDLRLINPVMQKYKFNFEGRMTGDATIKDPFQNFTLLSDIKMNDLIINGEELGAGEFLANWNTRGNKIHIISSLGKGLVPALRMEGDYYPESKVADFNFDLDKMKLKVFHTYTDFLVSDVKGIATGKLSLKGTLLKPEVNGSIRLMKSSFLVDYLQTRYNFSNDISLVHNNVILKDFEFYDEKGNKALAEGTITTGFFQDFNLDLRIKTDNFEFLNTVEKDNPMFYGKIFAGGILRITGPADNLRLDITARSEKNSVFVIPLYTTEDVAVGDFIDWAEASSPSAEIIKTKPRYEVNLKGIQMNFDLEVTPDAEVQLIFDPKIGDIIKGKGSGNLKVLINTLGQFEIYGDIIIEQGDYLFTLKNIINKKFTVEKGGRLSWNGDPEDANIDLKAIYNLKTTTSALDPTQDQLASRKRIPVDCILNLSGKLMNPTIQPDISLPGADQQTTNIVKNSINTDEEMMKQFVSLLVMNNFYSQQGFAQGGGGTAGVTTTELLSNQLSSWLSQISNDFDIGVNYRPGDMITSDELEVALSTQILNDRLTISGNLDMGGKETGTSSATTTNNIAGDFDINFKVTDKFNIKAFNRANDNLLFQTSPYTQGVGIFYKEYFDNFRDLTSRFKKSEKKDTIRTSP
jgi:hypothetical protein